MRYKISIILLFISTFANAQVVGILANIAASQGRGIPAPYVPPDPPVIDTAVDANAASYIAAAGITDSVFKHSTDLLVKDLKRLGC